jgi:hypothetical protein
MYGFSKARWILKIWAHFPYFPKETASFFAFNSYSAPRGHFPKYPLFKSNMEFIRKKLSHQNDQKMFPSLIYWIPLGLKRQSFIEKLGKSTPQI